MNRKTEWTDPMKELPDDSRTVQAAPNQFGNAFSAFFRDYVWYKHTVCGVERIVAPDFWRDLDEPPPPKPMVERWIESLLPSNAITTLKKVPADCHTDSELLLYPNQLRTIIASYEAFRKEQEKP